MASWRSVLTLLGVVGGTLFLLTATQADEEPRAGSPADRITQLICRIEQLERRVQTLEARPQAIQQSAHAQPGAEDWVSPPSAASPPNSPPFGIVYQLKRFTPDPPATIPSNPDGKRNITFGGVEIRR